MSEFKFYCPIDVRYGDLDPQGHVNNAKYLTYFEHARTHYKRHLGLFDEGKSFDDIGVIVADIHITFHAPIPWARKVKVGVRTARLGNKSMTVEQNIVDAKDGSVFATGQVILVMYDYRKQKTMRIPDEWREIILDFEEISH